MSGTSWEEARLMIMDKLEKHSADIGTISRSVNDLEISFTKSMTELQTKMMLMSVIGTSVVGTIVTIVVSKVIK